MHEINPDKNPFDSFNDWYEAAEKTEPSYPNAMTVASVSEDGRPSARITLLKEWNEEGYVFYTNFESRKGQEILKNKHVALCFYWKSLKKQIRIEGIAKHVSEEQAQAYFNSRPRMSRLGAWASEQSRPLNSRDTLEERVATFEEKFKGREFFQKPPHWSGFRVIPESFEFWEEIDFRLHNRFLFTQDESGQWQSQRLYP